MKLIISFMLLMSSVCFADMAMNGVSAKMASRAAPKIVKLNVLKTNLHAKTSLTENQKKFSDLLPLADLLKITEISSYHGEPESTDLPALSAAITAAIQAHPNWDVKVSLKGLSQENLKVALGEKSYSWAWVLKQNGDIAGAKKILTDLYQTGSEAVLRLNSLYDDSPLVELGFIQKALIPMSTKPEVEAMDAKMQKMKIHISNLPDARMMT